MQADYMLDYDVISVAREQDLYVMARIQAGTAAGEAPRRPLNLSIVLDRSGSMAGDKLDYVKQAAQYLVQRLGGQDYLSVVTYNQLVSVDLPPTKVQHKDAINQAIRQIKSSGTTNLSGGWLQGCQLVKDNMGKSSQQHPEGQVNRVLLLTDGLANEGVTNTDKLKALARQKRSDGISTTTMGVGLDFNEDLMTSMAAEGGGAFYFIDEPDQTPKIFAEELHDLLSVVGQNLVITLTLTGDVKMVRQYNDYPQDSATDAVIFRLGDIYAEEIKTLLMQLKIPALESIGEVEVARLRFEYDELVGDDSFHRVLELPIVVNAIDPDQDALMPARNQEVVKAALMLGAARAREDAINEADKGNFETAQDLLVNAAEAIAQTGLQDDALDAEHNMLREEALDMEMGSRRYDSRTRKAAATKSFMARRQSRSYDQTVALHSRLKSSRDALERSGPRPVRLTWKNEVFDLTTDLPLTIGRAGDNTIVIPEEEVSLHHCQIVEDGSDLYLEDLGSTNGTFANGGRVGERFKLSVGDLLTVGSWLFILRGD